MPVYKDESKGTYYCKFYYTDFNGQKKQKMKRGFKLQRDAKEWERTFLERLAAQPDMTFNTLYDLYVEDISSRLKASSVGTAKRYFKSRILPYFKELPINQITPASVRKWQNSIINSGVKPTTQRNINNQLNSILNFAVKYYGLSKNPCKVTGLIGKGKAERMEFWTHEEFRQFIQFVNNPRHRILYMILYYGGLRCGEALALTKSDIDTENRVIRVNKTFHRENSKDIITTPKTENSIRSVTIPEFLCNDIVDYMNKIYGLRDSDRIIQLAYSSLKGPFDRACKRAEVKQIRIHDIRHSHVSLLIDLGFPAMLIAERIGDTIDMVNNIYGHLYPNRHEEVADKLQELVSK